MGQHIIVTEYDPEWKTEYQKEAAVISAILGAELTEIHHIGSTAVRGLAAKPIIDIMPVVRDIRRVDALNPEFEKAGYECMGEFGIPGRRYFRKGGDDRTHQIHIFEESSRKDIIRHLAVRDYLRCHERAAAEYGALKRKLAKQFPESIEGYCEGKDAFVKQMEREAMKWYGQKQTRL